MARNTINGNYDELMPAKPTVRTDRESGSTPNQPTQNARRKTVNDDYCGVGDTVSGCKPSDKWLRYEITTNQMKNYVQGKLDTAITLYNRGVDKGEYAGPKMQPISIKAYTSKLSDKCLPLVIVLPETVEISGQKNNRKKGGNNGGGSMDITMTPQFNEGNNGSRGIRINDIVYRVMTPFMFVPKEITTTEYKSRNNLSTQNAELLKSDSSFRRMRSKKRKETVIMIWLNPFAIIHQMLKFKNGDTRQYNTNIIESKSSDKKASGSYVYNVVREINPNGKHKGKGDDGRDSIMSLIESQM